MKNTLNVDNFDFFTLNVEERSRHSEGIMYLLVKPGALRIQAKKEKSFLSNAFSLELLVDIQENKIKNDYRNILFCNFESGEVLKLDSILMLNNLSDFKEEIEKQSKKQDWIEREGSLGEGELEAILKEIESIKINELIDKSLDERDPDMFNILTS